MESTDYSSQWDLTLSNVKKRTSKIDRKRQLLVANKFQAYCNDKKPEIHNVLEYFYRLINIEAMAPYKTYKTLVYLQSLSPAMDNMPKFIAAFCKYKPLLSPEQVLEAIESIQDKSVQSYAALCSAGIQFHARYISLKIEEYDSDRRVVRDKYRIPSWLAKYLLAQKQRAISCGLGPSDMLFFKMKKDGTIDGPIKYGQYRSATERIKLEKGIDLRKHNFLNYRTYDLDNSLPVAIIGGTYNDWR